MMLQKRETLLLVAGLLAGAAMGLIAGYGIHDTPAQGDLSGLAGAAGIDVNLSQMPDSLTAMIQQNMEYQAILDQQIAAQYQKICDLNNLTQQYKDQIAELKDQLSRLPRKSGQYTNVRDQIDALTDKLEEVYSDSRKAMVEMQTLLARREQSSQMVNDLIARYQDPRGAPMPNLR